MLDFTPDLDIHNVTCVVVAHFLALLEPLYVQPVHQDPILLVLHSQFVQRVRLAHIRMWDLVVCPALLDIIAVLLVQRACRVQLACSLVLGVRFAHCVEVVRIQVLGVQPVLRVQPIHMLVVDLLRVYHAQRVLWAIPKQVVLQVKTLCAPSVAWAQVAMA